MVPYSHKASNFIQDSTSTSLSDEKNPAGTKVDPKTMERDLSSDYYRSYMKSLHGMDLPREFALPEWTHTGMGLNAKKVLKGDVGTKFGFMTPKQMMTYFKKEHGMVLPELRIEKADE